MLKFSKLGSVAFAAAVFAATGAYASDQTEVLDHSAQVADHMRSDPSFKPAREMLDKARGILIVPGLVKGGFIFGAEGGNGVLLEKKGKGWSEPAFYAVGSASFGLQIGLEKAEIAMLIMSDRALKALESGDFKLGAGAGLTVVTLSGGAEAATPTNLAGDIIIWTSATGLYGGLTLNGSVIKPREEWNAAYYGHSVTVPAIFASEVRNPAGNPLRQKLVALK